MMFASGFSSPGLPSRTDRYPHQNNSRAFSTQGDGTSSPLSPPNARAILLNQQLDALRSSHHEQSEEASFASKLMVAALLSIQDPLLGYDQRFGKPALKTYRSFVFPKQKEENENIQVQAAASRCARQIDFLVKRHQSHETQWIRHHDSQDDYQRETQTFPIVLVLDNLRSALNVGSIYRTAETCACLQVLTCGITPHPHGSGAEKIRKSALGAE
jgi:tRNA G18 (ribose-2'-O)-methylase SpoU